MVTRGRKPFRSGKEAVAVLFLVFTNERRRRHANETKEPLFSLSPLCLRRRSAPASYTALNIDTIQLTRLGQRPTGHDGGEGKRSARGGVCRRSDNVADTYAHSVVTKQEPTILRGQDEHRWFVLFLYMFYESSERVSIFDSIHLL